MLILAVSWGLSLSQNAPSVMPSNPQNILMVKALTILKLMTRSIGAVIYTPAIMAA